MISRPRKRRRQDPSSTDSWHQPSWNTLHRAAFSRSSLSVSPLSFLRSAPFICFPQLCSSSVIWLTAEADSGMEGIRWFQLEKLHSFCVWLWTLPLSSCLFYSYTLKQKNMDEKNPQKPFTHIANNRLFSNISTRWNETNLSPNLSALLLWHVLYIRRVDHNTLCAVLTTAEVNSGFHGDPEWAMGVSCCSHLSSAQPSWTPSVFSSSQAHRLLFCPHSWVMEWVAFALLRSIQIRSPPTVTY